MSFLKHEGHVSLTCSKRKALHWSSSVHHQMLASASVAVHWSLNLVAVLGLSQQVNERNLRRIKNTSKRSETTKSKYGVDFTGSKRGYFEQRKISNQDVNPLNV